MRGSYPPQTALVFRVFFGSVWIHLARVQVVDAPDAPAAVAIGGMVRCEVGAVLRRVAPHGMDAAGVTAACMPALSCSSSHAAVAVHQIKYF